MMHPLVEYAFVLVGLAVGYRTGGYLGTFLILTSVVAGFRQYIQVTIRNFSFAYLIYERASMESARVKRGWMVRQL